VKWSPGPRAQVGTVYATDADIGANAQLQFSLVDVVQGERDLFGITPGGVLYTTADVDRERSDMHVLRLAVTDDGYPQLSSLTDVTIHVLDRNDRYPFCGQAVYSATVPENSPVRVELGQSLLHASESCVIYCGCFWCLVDPM